MTIASSLIYPVSNDIELQYALTLNETLSSYSDGLHVDYHNTKHIFLVIIPTLRGIFASTRAP